MIYGHHACKFKKKKATHKHTHTGTKHELTKEKRADTAVKSNDFSQLITLRPYLLNKIWIWTNFQRSYTRVQFCLIKMETFTVVLNQQVKHEYKGECHWGGSLSHEVHVNLITPSLLTSQEAVWLLKVFDCHFCSSGRSLCLTSAQLFFC